MKEEKPDYLDYQSIWTQIGNQERKVRVLLVSDEFNDKKYDYRRNRDSFVIDFLYFSAVILLIFFIVEYILSESFFAHLWKS